MSKMEIMEAKKPRPHPSFAPDFKPEIVELCRRSDRSIGQEIRSDRDERAHLVEFVGLPALSERR
jgi:hypothetical protein